MNLEKRIWHSFEEYDFLMKIANLLDFYWKSIPLLSLECFPHYMLILNKRFIIILPPVCVNTITLYPISQEKRKGREKKIKKRKKKKN